MIENSIGCAAHNLSHTDTVSAMPILDNCKCIESTTRDRCIWSSPNKPKNGRQIDRQCLDKSQQF